MKKATSWPPSFQGSLVKSESWEDWSEMKPSQKEGDPFTARVIGCAIEVHRALGPGLLESTYQQCLAHELHLEQIPVRTEYPMPVRYKGRKLDCGYRIDLLIDDRLIVELKADDQLAGIHRAQLLTYLKLAGIATGLLINFNVQKLVDGIERLAELLHGVSPTEPRFATA